MKKKLKDLTNEEMEKICNKHYDKHKRCAGCILNIGNDHCMKYLDLDKEIEVEENDFN